MLGRSQSTRFDHNQENPHAHLHHKTPARAGKGSAPAGPAPVTGGKGALQQQTAKSGRVLGAKDRNGGKNGQQDPSTLLFPAKPGASASQAQPGPSCAPRPVQQQFKTPLPNKTLRSSQELRTPATALRPRHAPALMLGSPDVSMDVDVDEDQQEPQEEEDREVEYAGPSARDYDEPYVPDFAVPDFKTAGYGTSVRSMPLAGLEDPEDWARQDALERSSFKAELDEELSDCSDLSAAAAPQPLFPAPKRRAPLAVKPANTTSLGSSTSSRARVPASLAGSSAAGSARIALAGSVLASRRPLAPPTGTPGSSRSAGSAASTAPTRGGMQPPSRLGPTSTKPGPSTTTRATSSSSSSGAGRPLLGRAPSTSSSLLGSSTARPRPPPLALPLSRPASSSSLRSANSTTAAPLSPAQVAARRKADEQAAERELGAFGLVEDDGDDLIALEGPSEAFQFGDEESFKLDLDLEL